MEEVEELIRPAREDAGLRRVADHAVRERALVLREVPEVAALLRAVAAVRRVHEDAGPREERKARSEHVEELSVPLGEPRVPAGELRRLSPHGRHVALVRLEREALQGLRVVLAADDWGSVHLDVHGPRGDVLEIPVGLYPPRPRELLQRRRVIPEVQVVLDGHDDRTPPETRLVVVRLLAVQFGDAEPCRLELPEDMGVEVEPRRAVLLVTVDRPRLLHRDARGVDEAAVEVHLAEQDRLGKLPRQAPQGLLERVERTAFPEPRVLLELLDRLLRVVLRVSRHLRAEYEAAHAGNDGALALEVGLRRLLEEVDEPEVLVGHPRAAPDPVVVVELEGLSELAVDDRPELHRELAVLLHELQDLAVRLDVVAEEERVVVLEVQDLRLDRTELAVLGEVHVPDGHGSERPPDLAREPRVGVGRDEVALVVVVDEVAVVEEERRGERLRGEPVRLPYALRVSAPRHLVRIRDVLRRRRDVLQLARVLHHRRELVRRAEGELERLLHRRVPDAPLEARPVGHGALGLAPDRAVALRRHDGLEVLLEPLGVDVGPRRRVGALLRVGGHEPRADLLEHVVHDVREVAATVLRESRRVRQLPAEDPERAVEVFDLPVSGRAAGISVAQFGDLPERTFEQRPRGRHVTR